MYENHYDPDSFYVPSLGPSDSEDVMSGLRNSKKTLNDVTLDYAWMLFTSKDPARERRWARLWHRTMEDWDSAVEWYTHLPDDTKKGIMLADYFDENCD